MNIFLGKLCKIASNLFMIEEIFKQTLFVLIYSITNTIIRIIALPLMYIIKGLIGIAEYADNQSKYHCKNLQELYTSLFDNQEEQQ